MQISAGFVMARLQEACHGKGKFCALIENFLPEFQGRCWNG